MRRISSLVLFLVVTAGCSTLPTLTPADLDRLTRDSQALSAALSAHAMADHATDPVGAAKVQAFADLAGKVAQGSDLAARLLAADQGTGPAPAPATK